MIKTRFPPSPTGLIHLGNARTALFSALFAVHNKGEMLLRIEDTDVARSEIKYTDQLLEDLHWLGVEWQEGPGVGGANGPYWQSQRTEIYAKYYQQLEQEHLAYPCFCSEQELAVQRKIQLSRGKPPRYSGKCRNLSKAEYAEKIAQGLQPVLRFHVPDNVTITFTDLVRGEHSFNSDDIGDFVIRRADGGSSFLCCNAIDDSLMGVTDVLRGEDHLTNTPRQLMILSALKLRAPRYGHFPLIVGPDGTPLSKRHGSFSLFDMREQGYLAVAILNYMARLGHTYPQLHLMKYAELAAHFNIAGIGRAPARFDQQQLLHWQKEAIAKLSNDELWAWVKPKITQPIPDAARHLFIEVIRGNIVFPADAAKWAEIFFAEQLNFSSDQQEILTSAGEAFFLAVQTALEKHGTDLKAILQEVKTVLNVSGKDLYMPVRVALSGEIHGPELIHITNLLGPAKMLQRFERALRIAQGME